MTGTGEFREPERVIVLLRGHARVLVLPVILLLVLSAGTVYGTLALDEEWMRWAALGAGVLGIVLLCLVPYVRWLASHTLLTTRRIVTRRGLVVRTRREVLHSRGYDVVLRQSWPQRLFRTGDVIIKTGSENPVVLRDVPRAVLVQEALSDLMEHSHNSVVEARRQTGPHPL
jgi:uncharacterized membrane protein YdbT with pleckstrin-like domain